MKHLDHKARVRWYLAEWREHRDLGQDEVAAKIETNKGQISKLETGKQRMNDRWIASLARAYRIPPFRLLRHPDEPTVDDLLTGATPDELKKIRQTVAMMLGKSDD